LVVGYDGVKIGTDFEFDEMVKMLIVGEDITKRAGASFVAD
jgi:hypothetical protein